MRALLLLLTIATINSLGSEVDNFVRFKETSKDVSVIMNKHTNDLIKVAINKANGPYKVWVNERGIYKKRIKTFSCSKKYLYKEMKGVFAKPLKSQVEEYVVDHPFIISQLRTPYKSSIFNGFPGIGLITQLPIGRLGSLININGYYVGSDKFGHFHTEGLDYFKMVYMESKGASSNFLDLEFSSIDEHKNLKKALDWGEMVENTYFGKLTTGVYSYGDLTANFNGMRFWIHLLGDYYDPLGASYNHAPYVSCIEGKWSQVNDFKWEDYIDETFDETINCNDFASTKLAKIHESNIKKLYGESIECGVHASVKLDLKRKYGEFFTHLFNVKQSKK